MFHSTLSAWRGSKTGRALLAAYVVLATGVTLNAFLTRRRTKSSTRNKSSPKGPSGSAGSSSSDKSGRDSPPSRRSLSRIIKLALNGAGEPGSRLPVLSWVTLLSAGTLARLFASMKLSRQIGVLGKHLAAKDWKALPDAQLHFALLAVPAAAFTAFVTFATDRLALSLRTNLSSAVREAYVSASAPAVVSTMANVSQVDSRVTADVDTLSTELSSLYLSLYKPVVEVVVLSASLSHMMGLTNLLKCYGAFAALGGWSRYVSPSFRTLAAAVAGGEADLRATHERSVRFAPEIEALHGRPAEAKEMESRFNRLRSLVAVQQFRTGLSSALDTYSVRHLGTLVAFTAMLPAVHSENADVPASSPAVDSPVEYFLTCLHLLVNVGIACKDLVQSFRKLSAAVGHSARVCELLDSLEAAQDGDTAAATSRFLRLEGSHPAVRDLAIAVPGATAPLLRGVTFDMTQSVLITGPNGSGKTSLLRVMAGVTDPCAGNLVLPIAAAKDLMYIPQRPYLLPSASIREQLLYPGRTPEFDPTDDELVEVLLFVGLPDLPSTCEGLDATAPPTLWQGLSTGEKQRVCLARLFLRRPRFALLDECTSGVPPDFERRVYTRLQEDNVTYATVSHRTRNVRQFHCQELELDGNGLALTKETM